VLSTAWAPYVNDFPNQGRMQRVVVQAEGDQRSQVEDLLKICAQQRREDGAAVGVRPAKWTQGPAQLTATTATRRSRFPAKPHRAQHRRGDGRDGAPGRQLPAGFGQEWTGLSLQERLSGTQAPILLGLSLLIVFLCLAALYELVDPDLGAAGGAAGRARRGAGGDLRGMPNDVFFKVGLITIIGLSAKNAILIIEFAKDLYDQGKT
jgi:multidrug efflux pump